MRQIKFRGKQIHGNEWLYGYYFAYESAGNGKVYHSIVPEKYSSKPSDYFHVIPETIGQFTGLTDKNGKEIYHKDRVNHENYGEGVIEWDDKFATFFIDFGSEDFELQMVILSECELLNEKQ